MYTASIYGIKINTTISVQMSFHIDTTSHPFIVIIYGEINYMLLVNNSQEQEVSFLVSIPA